MDNNGTPANDKIAKAWQRVVWDCGCPDIYYRPSSEDIECPRHTGFSTCCARTTEHVPGTLELVRTLSWTPSADT